MKIFQSALISNLTFCINAFNLDFNPNKHLGRYNNALIHQASDHSKMHSYKTCTKTDQFTYGKYFYIRNKGNVEYKG